GGGSAKHDTGTLRRDSGGAARRDSGAGQRESGGGLLGGKKSDEFRISAPLSTTRVKHGETKTVKVSLNRGKNFHQNVKLTFDAPKGLKVDPPSAEIKASDKDEIEVRISVEKDAPAGDHTIKIVGTPDKGDSTSVDMKVKVEAAK